ncbi:GHKL domain-containing protein [Epibacterium sp. SM1979]|uniref:histidine kinase n=1 Tax=Tritonibacter litoralis TaxID=2662264 RepID=A0A843YF72_9RHOB|nr:GHKL domain-containing protein [Tritonibacter litoralis]
MRLLVYLGYALVFALALFRLAHEYFRTEELARAEGRLSLYRSTVEAELERFSHLTHVLAQDSFVTAALSQSATATLNIRLADFARRAGLDAIYLMQPDGRTIAASNYATAHSFVEQNYGFRPYFQDALNGQQGRFYAIGATTGAPGYFIADPVRREDGSVQGVIAIKIDLSTLAQNWRASGENVLLADQAGVVLLASNPAWQYQTLSPLPADIRRQIEAVRQFPGQPLTPLDWQPGQTQRVTIAGAKYLHLTGETNVHGWQLHYFATDDRALARAGLVTSVALVFLGAGVGVLLLRRNRRIRAALFRSESEENKLRTANARLAQEITVRREAEQQLRRTQSELERTSRLAALGQVAASVTHELGQPIAAMRNHLAAAQMLNTNSEPLVGNISSLVARMEGITRQLKFFARSGEAEFEPVDLGAALNAVLDLVEPNRAEIAAEIVANVPPDPAMIRGSRLRVEQVLTNLLRNALDAVEGEDAPKVELTLTRTAETIALEIRDNGHGLGAATLADLQEPFVTTRESGRGMGLGLAISAQIVKEHGGTLEARNGERRRGAVFCLSFPTPDQSEVT